MDLQISLNGLQAPRLARKDGTDEAFAWASRDALRVKCIGKSVSFVVERIDGMSKREYGSVSLASGENLSESIVVRALPWATAAPCHCILPALCCMRSWLAVLRTATIGSAWPDLSGCAC
jgi:hypothetical protein